MRLGVAVAAAHGAWAWATGHARAAALDALAALCFALAAAVDARTPPAGGYAAA
jgi:hypothetical protein